MPGAQEDRGNARKGHASEAGRNPGGGAAREQKGGRTKAGVRKGDGAPPRACKGEGVRAGRCATRAERRANGRVGAPKRGCEKEPATGDSAPPRACKGRGCVSGAAR